VSGRYTLNQRVSLPKWAQSELSRLESNIKYLEAKIAAFDQPGGRIVVNPYSDSARFHLSDDTRIEFRLDNPSDDLSGAVMVSLVKGNSGKFRVELNGSGGFLTVTPRAANAIEVGMRDSWD
jgi:hypothetical protein